MKETGKKILIIGSGGREAVLADAYDKSPQVAEIHIWPGNGLIYWNCQNEVYTYGGEAPDDVKGITDFVRARKIDFVDVACDDALGAGVVDAMQRLKIPAFGPASGAAKLETDKYFSRKIQSKWGLPIPKYRYFRRANRELLHSSLQDWQESLPFDPRQGVVVKANGLAAGKGVAVASNIEEGHEKINYILNQGLGLETGILLEEKVGGPNAEEFSAFFLTDTIHYFLLGFVQDHKQLLDGGHGPNTGGMGCVTPVSLFDSKLAPRFRSEIASKIGNGIRSFRRSCSQGISRRL